MDIVQQHVIIDEVLSAWGTALGAARTPYKGHVYRVFNLARRLARGPKYDDELAVAAAFHDLGIWSDRTFDYLTPSIGRAREYLAARAPQLDVQMVTQVIDLHHRMRAVRTGAHVEAIEAFRRADLVDVSFGVLTSGLDRTFIKELTTKFPYAGFHSVLMETAFAWFVRHPFRPMPMMRW